MDPITHKPTRGLCYVLTLLAAWLVINLVTASRSPTVWQDEIQCTDSVINLINGHGFVSTTLNYQTSDKMLPWPAPAHSIAVYAMIKTFGFNITAVRATNFIFMIGVALLLHATLRRSGLVRSANLRLFWVVLLLCGWGITFDYRSARYDIVGILFLSLAAYSLTVRGNAGRAMLLLSGLILPFSGMQLLPLAAVVGLGLWIAFGRRAIPAGLLYGGGVAVGLLAYYTLYRSFGIWDDLVRAVQAAATSQSRLRGSIAALKVVELSSLAMAPALAVLLIQDLRNGVRWNRSPALLGLLTVPVIPMWMGAAGRYPLYYTWMVFLPVSICFAVALDRVWLQKTSRWVVNASLAFGIIACGVGFPARMALLLREWNDRNYQAVIDFVNANIKDTDHVYANPQGFYPLKSRPDLTVFFVSYNPLLTDEQRARMDTAVVGEEEVAEAANLLGGSWNVVARMRPAGSVLNSGLGARKYNLVVARRTGPTTLPTTRPIAH